MDIEDKIWRLLRSDLTGYEIYKRTGVDQSVISKLRNGEREIGNLNVSTAQKLLDLYTKEIEND